VPSLDQEHDESDQPPRSQVLARRPSLFGSKSSSKGAAATEDPSSSDGDVRRATRDAVVDLLRCLVVEVRGTLDSAKKLVRSDAPR
jgi:hypothetical protein